MFNLERYLSLISIMCESEEKAFQHLEEWERLERVLKTLPRDVQEKVKEAVRKTEKVSV